MSAPHRRILVVDDDLTIRTVLRMTLARQGYDVFVSSDALEALELLKKQPVDLVISDNAMPRMGGIQFLNEVRDRHPETIRILLTANADTETAIRAINEGQIYKFLTKPWDPVAMKVMLDAAFVHLDRDREHRRLLARARGFSDRVLVQG